MTPLAIADPSTWFAPGPGEPDFSSASTRELNLFREREDIEVLIVEPETATLVAMTEILRGYGIRVRAARDGEEASVLVKKHRFPGIFLTLPLFGCESAELIQEIRRSWWNSTSPVVVLGDHSSTREMSLAAVVGATMSASKPMTPSALSRMMEVARSAIALERRRLCRPGIPLIAECQFATSAKFLVEIHELRQEGGLLRTDQPMSLSEVVQIR